jgi:Fe-S cluster assembly protein SufD
MSAVAERIVAELSDSPRARAAAELLRAALAPGLPTNRDENWKYASLRTLERLRLTSVAPAAAALDAAAALLPERLAGHCRVVLVDGHFAPSLSDAPTAGLIVAAEPQQPAPAAGVAADADLRWLAVNAAFAAGAVRLVAEASSTHAVEICSVTTLAGTTGGAHPRVELQLASGATVTVVERQLSTTESTALTNAGIEARLGSGAVLRHVRLQTLAARAQLVETLRIDVGRDARFELVQVSLGAQAARTTALIDLSAAGAACKTHVASLADGSRVHDHFHLIAHNAPQTQTEQRVRGIAAGRARVAFNGHIRMAAGAIGASSEQSLRGLQSGAQCEIDLRPQLEIYVDAVKASHGATVGKLDEQMLFYLLSRGLDRDTAQGLLKWAFVADALTSLADPALRRQIDRELARSLGDAPSAMEAP